MRFEILRSGCVALLLCTLAAGCGAPAESKRLAVGDPAPGFSLTTLDGSQIEMRSFVGKPTLVSFWATWCSPCYKEIPVLKELALKDGVDIVTIALDKEGARVVQPFVEEHDIQYRVALGDQETFQRFNGFSIPYTLLLDGSHQVVNVYRGPVTREVIDRDLARIATGA